MIGSMVAACDTDLSPLAPKSIEALREKDVVKRWRALAQAITALELGHAEPKLREALRKAADTAKVPVLGITGTGGAGRARSPTSWSAAPPRPGRCAVRSP